MLENVPLSGYSTMRLGGRAAYLSDITSREELVQALQLAHEQQLPVKLIGGGSNIIWNDAGFSGVVLVNKIQGVATVSEFGESVYLTVASGENWDDFVAHTVSLDLSGIECLSLIPGTVGATPIQNVGAYGAEVSQTISTIEAYDKKLGSFVTLRGSECEFAYRTSRFKNADKDRFYITAVTFALSKSPLKPPFYGALQSYFDQHAIVATDSQTIRQAVIAIRNAKLPDPKLIANSGSFFANPIIDRNSYTPIATAYPNVPHWEVGPDTIKLSAAWLIDQAGFKDYHDQETGMATWAAQPLVLINEQAHSTEQLLAFRDKISSAVAKKFGIRLVQEPELI